MVKTRSKRRRLMSFSSYASPWPDLPAIFESLNDDTLTTVLEFVGGKSYAIYAGINKHCREIYLNTNGMTKETFLYGYAPLSMIQDRYDRTSYLARVALSKGVVFYNRRDVLNWALQEYDEDLLEDICDTAAKEGKIDLLIEVWNNVNDYDEKRFVYRDVDGYAAEGGKLEVLKWLETKGICINKNGCAETAAYYGQLHILKWLQEEKGLELYERLYVEAIYGGGHLHVMMWLREQGCPFQKRSRWGESSPVRCAALKGNLDILQWLHDEGCPWPEDHPVNESQLKPEVIEWLRSNGYGDRIIVGR